MLKRNFRQPEPRDHRPRSQGPTAPRSAHPPWRPPMDRGRNRQRRLRRRRRQYPQSYVLPLKMLAALEKFRDIGARRKPRAPAPCSKSCEPPRPGRRGRDRQADASSQRSMRWPCPAVDPYPAQSTIVLCANGLCGHVLVTLISASSATTSAPRATSGLISISSSVASTVDIVCASTCTIRVTSTTGLPQKPSNSFALRSSATAPRSPRR